MNWEPSMDPYELRKSIGENLEETCQHGDKAFPCAGYRDHYRRGREGYPWHWHDEWEIAFVEQGQVRAQVNGEQHLLGPGEGIFINRRVLHAFSLEGDGEVWMPNLLFLPSLLYGSQESVFWRNTQSPWPSPRGAPIWCCGRTSPGRGRRWPRRGGPTPCWRRTPTAMSCGCARPFPRCWWRWRATCRNCPASPAGTRRKSAGCGRCSPLSRGTTPSLCGWRTSLPACSSAGGSACGLFKMCWASPPSNTSSSCGCARQRSFCWRRG